MRWARILTVCLVCACAFAWGAEEKAEPVQGTVTGENVYVRPAPNRSSGYLFKAYKGDKLVVLGRDGNWYKVKVPPYLRFWIATTFAKVAANGKTATLSSDRVNLRGGPGTEYEVVGQLGKGAKFLVETKVQGYICLKPETGSEGWIFHQYCSLPKAAVVAVVDSGATGPGPTTTRPVATRPAVKQVRDTKADKEVTDIKAKLVEEMKKPEGSREIEPLFKRMHDIIGQTKDALVRMRARVLYNHYSPILQQELRIREHKERLKRIEENLAKIRKKYESSATKPAYQAPVAVGVVSRLSYKRFSKAATHSLRQGKRITFLLTSATMKLEPLEGATVELWGSVSQPEGYPAGVSLLEVTKANVLAKPEK